MQTSSRALYWQLALRLIDRASIINWADSLIEDGVISDDIIFLSTCSSADENEILSALSRLQLGSEHTVGMLIGALINYYSTCTDESAFNTSLLLDYTRISDFDETVRVDLICIEDDACLVRDGIVVTEGTLSQYIMNRLCEIRPAQQDD